MSTRPTRHSDLLSRSTDEMIDALGDLRAVSEEMVGLLTSRRAGMWGAGEARRYSELRRREQGAHRRYVAAQRWHDAVRRRLLELA
jgi:hypothetical protein